MKQKLRADAEPMSMEVVEHMVLRRVTAPWGGDCGGPSKDKSHIVTATKSTLEADYVPPSKYPTNGILDKRA